MTSEKKLQSIARYDRENCKRICLKLNKKYDAEVIQQLERVKNKQGYIKELILADIMKGVQNEGKRTLRRRQDD